HAQPPSDAAKRNAMKLCLPTATPAANNQHFRTLIVSWYRRLHQSMDCFRFADHLGVGRLVNGTALVGVIVRARCRVSRLFIRVRPAFKVEDWYIRSGGGVIFCL